MFPCYEINSTNLVMYRPTRFGLLWVGSDLLVVRSVPHTGMVAPRWAAYVFYAQKPLEYLPPPHELMTWAGRARNARMLEFTGEGGLWVITTPRRGRAVGDDNTQAREGCW